MNPKALNPIIFVLPSNKKYVYIKGSKVYHMTRNYPATSACGMAVGYDDEFTNTPHSRTLCKRCRKAYIKKHGEDSLFLELI